MAFSQRWKTVLKKHMDAVPRGSPFPAFKAATKAASAEYHGLSTHLSRGNPDYSGLIKLAFIGGIGLLAVRAVQAQQTQNTPTGNPPAPTATGL